MTNNKTMEYKYKFKAAAFKITAKTNMHPGSGSENYGVIDNLVQRDTVTNFPCINSSSLKGALREYFKHYLEPDNDFITAVFGHDPKVTGDDIKDKEEEYKKKGKTNAPTSPPQQAGKFRFFDAQLISIPIRSTNATMYYHNSCNELKDEFISKTKLFQINVDINKVFDANISLKDCLMEFSKKVSDYELPVIARNYLVNGESQNLWYEQILPRETQMYFIVLYPHENKAQFDIFKEEVEKNLVQIGANASIGYGFCEIELIDEIVKTKEA